MTTHNADKYATDETNAYNIDFDKYIFMKDEVFKKITFSFDLSNSYIVSDEDAENSNWSVYSPNPVMKNISLPSINSSKTINYDGEAKYSKYSDYIADKLSVYLKKMQTIQVHKLKPQWIHMLTMERSGWQYGQSRRHGVLFFNKVTINVPYSLEAIWNNIMNTFKDHQLQYTSSSATTVLGNSGVN